MLNQKKTKKLILCFLVIVCVNVFNAQLNYYKLSKRNIPKDLDSATVYNDLAIKSAIANNDLSVLQLVYIQKGNINFYKNKFEKAIECYLESSKINEQLNNKDGLVKNYTDIAFVYSTISTEFTKYSLSWLNKAKKLTTEQADSTVVYYKNRSGVILLRLGKYKEARENFNYVLKSKFITSKSEIAALYNNIGITFQKEGNYNLAQDYFEICVDTCQRYKETRLLGICYSNLSRNFFLDQKHKQALDYGFKAKSILISTSTYPKLIETYKTLFEIYQTLGKQDSALFYHKKHFQLKDSLFSENVKQQISNIENKLEVDLKNLQLESKNKEIAYNKNQKRAILYITVSLAVIVLILIVFFVLLRNRNKELIAQRKIVKESLTEKELLLGEIHHRVKNNLQLVAGLLELQLKNVKDSNAQGALEESRNRINTMLLLHRNLYHDDKFAYIEAAAFFDNIIAMIKSGYSFGNQIQFLQEVQALKLIVDASVPIGLILNELITNSIKYAFKKNENPSITIKFFLSNNLLHFYYLDNGIGFNYNEIQKGFGLKLINSLCRQLDAEVITEGGNGCSIKLIIKNFMLYEKN